jgi:peptide deformylase
MDEMITINTAQPTAIKVVYEPYELVGEDNSILKQKMEPFDFSSEIDPKEISNRLIQTLKNHRAYGLAANQCGLYYRVFVVGAENEYVTLFNPEITYLSEETVHLEEACLSFPFMFLNITRPKRIGVKYQDENGQYKEVQYDGLTARVVLHETDHLNGITFDEKAKPLALKNAKKSREKKIKQFARELVSQRGIKIA